MPLALHDLEEVAAVAAALAELVPGFLNLMGLQQADANGGVGKSEGVDSFHGWQDSCIGGWDGASFHSDGAIYSPTANTWTTLPSAGAPSARGYHTAVMSNVASASNEMIVWGGWDGTTFRNDGAIYKVTSNATLQRRTESSEQTFSAIRCSRNARI